MHTGQYKFIAFESQQFMINGKKHNGQQPKTINAPQEDLVIWKQANHSEKIFSQNNAILQWIFFFPLKYSIEERRCAYKKSYLGHS